MQYTASRPFHGDGDRALRLAESSLTGIGFRIAARTGDALEMAGPGMSSTRQSALLGATCVRITAARGQLALEAELGGARRMARFVTVFPIALVLGLGVVLCAVFTARFDHQGWILAVAAAVGGNAVLWMFVGPLMAKAIRKRTKQALQTLLANMASVGEAE